LIRCEHSDEILNGHKHRTFSAKDDHCLEEERARANPLLLVWSLRRILSRPPVNVECFEGCVDMFDVCPLKATRFRGGPMARPELLQIQNIVGSVPWFRRVSFTGDI
jgi:hypothetical protein